MLTNRKFRDRLEAGSQLSKRLLGYAGQDNVIAAALPRGGVVVASEVAQQLKVALDIFIVRKLGVPGREELAMGAIASGGVTVVNEELVTMLGITEDAIARVAQQEEEELRRREELYRNGRPAMELKNKIVILIDDGLATGSSMRAAVLAVRQKSPRRLVVAVPVGSASVCQQLLSQADEAVCLRTPEPFLAVGQWYESFSQVSDDEVKSLLQKASQAMAA